MLSADYTLWGFATAKNILVLKYDTKISEQTNSTNYINQYVLYDRETFQLADINRKVWTSYNNTGWHGNVSISVHLYDRYGAQLRRINVQDSSVADWILMGRYLWQHALGKVGDVRADVIVDAYKKAGAVPAAAKKDLTRDEAAIIAKIGRQNQR